MEGIVRASKQNCLLLQIITLRSPNPVEIYLIQKSEECILLIRSTPNRRRGLGKGEKGITRLYRGRDGDAGKWSCGSWLSLKRSTWAAIPTATCPRLDWPARALTIYKSYVHSPLFYYYIVPPHRPDTVRIGTFLQAGRAARIKLNHPISPDIPLLLYI